MSVKLQLALPCNMCSSHTSHSSQAEPLEVNEIGHNECNWTIEQGPYFNENQGCICQFLVSSASELVFWYNQSQILSGGTQCL